MSDEKMPVAEFKQLPLYETSPNEFRASRSDYNAFMDAQGYTKEIRECKKNAEHTLREAIVDFASQQSLKNDLADTTVRIGTDDGEWKIIVQGPKQVRAGVPAKGEVGTEVAMKTRAFAVVERRTVLPDQELMKAGGLYEQHEQAFEKALAKRNKK